jgi:hypothetical protein
MFGTKRITSPALRTSEFATASPPITLTAEAMCCTFSSRRSAVTTTVSTVSPEGTSVADHAADVSRSETVETNEEYPKVSGARTLHCAGE